MYNHCSRHSFSISIFRFYQVTLLLTLSALFVGIVTPVCFNNYTSSFYFCEFLPSIFFEDLSYTLASLGCLFGLFACVCVHIQAEAPIPASPWGLSLCLVLFPSIDFENKPRRVPLTHFSLWCHFAYSAVPQLNKMDSGMMWGGKGSREHEYISGDRWENETRVWLTWTLREGKPWSRTWKPLSPLYPFTYLWEINSPWIYVRMSTQVEKRDRGGKKRNCSYLS